MTVNPLDEILRTERSVAAAIRAAEGEAAAARTEARRRAEQLVDEARARGKAVADRQYEEDNTYSNLLSTRYPWLNLLVLNFCYHNVHHNKPSEPWYRLPNT